MGTIRSKVLFLTTSPRTPEKMIPEIELLSKNFEGMQWDEETQKGFMDMLSKENFFNGEGIKDPAFSARDRINRGPKSLGFVSLSPQISITQAGKALLTSRRTDETLLRQLLKFQVPSPFHKPTADAAVFSVKPYLELIRLVRKLGTLKFDELQIFGMQLTNWHNFDAIVSKIEKFRNDKVKSTKSYREFKAKYLERELREIYASEISAGETKTRESRDKSIQKFITTKGSNMRDYADAAFRYLRATGLINVSHVGKSLSIVPERIADVDYILDNVEREPCFVNDEARYVEYLGDVTLPMLYTDNRDRLAERLSVDFPSALFNPNDDMENLKDLLFDLMEKRKEDNIQNQVREIKNYKLYDEIQGMFDLIIANKLYDAPLMLEWNTWRAMTMLDGGDIKANLKFDDFGKPLTTALGNMADIVCDYGDFMLSVEVTMASGQRQYDMESEPVSRHLGKLKKDTDKPCYSLFIAPTINEASIAHFYALHQMNILYYGGKSIIVPLPLKIFKKMLEDSYKADYTPNPAHVRKFFEHSKEVVKTAQNEQEWYKGMLEAAVNWLRL